MPTRCLIAGLRRFRTGRCRGACPHCSGQCRGETMWGADILVVRRIRPPPCRCLRAFPGAAAPTQLRRCPVCSGSDRSGPRSSMTPGPAPHRHGCGVPPPLLQPNSSRATAPRCAGRLRDERTRSDARSAPMRCACPGSPANRRIGSPAGPCFTAPGQPAPRRTHNPQPITRGTHRPTPRSPPPSHRPERRPRLLGR